MLLELNIFYPDREFLVIDHSTKRLWAMWQILGFIGPRVMQEIRLVRLLLLDSETDIDKRRRSVLLVLRMW